MLVSQAMTTHGFWGSAKPTLTGSSTSAAASRAASPNAPGRALNTEGSSPTLILWDACRNMGDVRSIGGQTTAGDYMYTRTHPFCCLTADSAAPPVDVCGPPFGDFRARARPLRQEPEWQLNDLDVQEAWRQIECRNNIFTTTFFNKNR